MNFFIRTHSSHLRRCRHHHLHIRTLFDAVSCLKCPRDRGLDHAVERDKHLKPLLNLKNLIISEPSKSVPLSLITESNETLGIPFRPIDFIRKYPSIFQEFYPGNLNIHPHIKLTPELISLSSEESLLYQSVNYKQDIAERLLKLLMINRVNKVPISLLERLKWELGLPQDYEKEIVPEFPDYFRVISGKNYGENEKVLELVCWGDEFAVSRIENKGSNNGKIEFSMHFSKEFEMDKKYKKWLDEWKKLPYVSPYQNAMHLAAKTDESDKWSVAVLHEVLSLFVGKKAERDTLLFLGEYLGLRSRFKRVFLQHPGIFYVSSKIGTHTVVLKEAYKRGMLIERHPLMDVRSKYIKLMNVVKDEEKTTQQKTSIDMKKSGVKEFEDVNSEEEDNDEMYDSSDDDVVDDNTDDDDDESDDQMEAIQGENVTERGNFKKKGKEYEEGNTRRSVARWTYGRGTEENISQSSSRFSRRTNVRGGDSNIPLSTRKKSDFSWNRANGRGTEENLSKSSSRFSRRTNVQGGDPDIPLRTRKTDFSSNRTNRRGMEENVSKNSSRFSRRTSVQDSQWDISKRNTKKSDFCGNGARSRTGKTPYSRNSAT